jgi:putative SOS response-associated peptidase YedK
VKEVMIITKAANKSVQEIHDRMPLMLDETLMRYQIIL